MCQTPAVVNMPHSVALHINPVLHIYTRICTRTRPLHSFGLILLENPNRLLESGHLPSEKADFDFGITNGGIPPAIRRLTHI